MRIFPAFRFWRKSSHAGELPDHIFQTESKARPSNDALRLTLNRTRTAYFLEIDLTFNGAAL